jgi:hypothetical protein
MMRTRYSFPMIWHQRNTTRIGLPILAGIVLAIACGRSAFAGSMGVSQELNVEYGYVAGAHTRNAGKVDENSADVRYVISPQVTKNLLLRIGAEWQRYDFGVSKNLPVPDLLQQASVILGFDYQIADLWIMRAEVQPGVYGDFRDVNWDDVDAPLALGAVYLKDPDLQWIIGLRVDLRSQYPVMPGIGVRWKYADQWTLNLVFPKPRLEYELSDTLLLCFGAEVKGGTFRMSEHFGATRGNPKLDNAVLDYTEIRIGPGCSWKALPNLTVEAGVGFMPYRNMNFFDRSTEIRSYNAPYGQITCNARF